MKQHRRTAASDTASPSAAPSPRQAETTQRLDGHPALEHNLQHPDGPALLARLSEVFDIEGGTRGFTDASCAWLEHAQQVLGMQTATPGVLDERTLLTLEEHVRAPESWAAAGLVRAALIADPEAMGTDAMGRWKGDTFDVGVDASALIPPESAGPQELFEFYAEILELAHPEWERGERAVLAIRGLAAAAEQGDTTQQTRLGWDMMVREQYESTTTLAERQGGRPELDSGYRDTFVVLQPDLTAERFAGGTVPTTVRSTMGSDVDGDGHKDSAMLQPGAYELWQDRYNGGDHRSWEVRNSREDDDVAVWRNSSQEGEASRQNLDAGGRFAERQVGLTDFWMSASDREQDFTASAIKFHAGANDAAGGVGCMTLPAEDFERFMAATGRPLEGETEASSQDFVLVDARDFLLSNPSFAERGGQAQTPLLELADMEALEARGPKMPELALPDWTVRR